MTSPSLTLTLAWLRSLPGEGVPSAWVPGASDLEREHLQALGSIAAHLLDGRAAIDWPADIQEWLREPVPLPTDVAAELDVEVKGSPDETLAAIYAQLVAGPRRRVLGTFFTPGDEVAPMLARWSETQGTPSEVVDVGAGVGVFTVAALGKWPAASVVAVDVNPVTLGLLGARVAQPDMAHATHRVELVLEDFTTWLPDHPANDGGRLVLGNPPFTRGQLIDPVTRARLREATQQLCGSRASLSAFITALTLKHLGPEDGLCLLLPAQWLESQYATKLRRHLLDAVDRQVELHLVPEDLFDDATVDAVVLLVGTQRDTPQEFMVAEWKKDGHAIDRSASGTDGWRTWFAPTAGGRAVQVGSSRRLDEFAVVRRGVATGANSFFLLSETTRVSHGLPDQVVQRVVHRLKMFPNGVHASGFAALPTTERSWLFSSGPEHAERDAVARYLQVGLDENIDKRYLCDARDTWSDLSRDVVIPDVIVTAMSKSGFRVVTNDARAAITNNLYGLTWRADVPQALRTKILQWLRSPEGQVAMLGACRQQGDGLSKLEPRALAALRLPSQLTY